MNDIELLAPAGNFESLVAAVQNGADAVYLGGTEFNARQYAKNFDIAEISKAIDYCHLRHVKIHITLNTLIHQNEIKSAYDYIKELCSIGPDAVIVQDMGIVNIIENYFKGLNIHASTQMTVHNIEGVKQLQKSGFQRVVLSRELSLDDIKNITGNCSIETEVFIHGALCVSYSGQCLMSSMIGGRSGNRGRCAQPCRMKYSLLNETQKKAEGYLLSTKDLCTIDFISKIVNTGVTSLKIEGRMKRPEYVAVVVNKYRKALDYILNKSDECIDDNDRLELLKIFNRGGFTKGYFYGTNDSSLMYHKMPNHHGVYCGKVVNIKNNYADIKIEKNILQGDGIEFRKNDTDHGGLTVRNVNIKNESINKNDNVISLKVPDTVNNGDYVYKTTDADQLKNTKKTFEDINMPMIPLSGILTLKKNEKASFYAEDDIYNSCYIQSDINVEEAKNSPVVSETVKRQINKTGGTPFYFSDIELNIDSNIYIPLKEVNELRRKALLNITEKRIDYYRNECVCTNDLSLKVNKNACLNNYHLLTCQVSDIDQAEAAIKAGADEVYFAPENYKDINNELISKINSLKYSNKKIYFVVPAILKGMDYEVLYNVVKKYNKSFDGIVSGNLGSVGLAEYFSSKNIIGDYNLNVFNSMAAAKLSKYGYKRLTLSAELTLSEIHDIIAVNNDLEYEIIVYGRIPLMNLAHCPIRSVNGLDLNRNKCNFCSGEKYYLLDRLNIKFPIQRIKMNECLVRVLNSKVLSVDKQFEKFRDLNINSFRLVFYNESNDEVRKIVGLYRDLIDGNKINDINILSKKHENDELTTGHFFRGVS